MKSLSTVYRHKKISGLASCNNTSSKSIHSGKSKCDLSTTVLVFMFFFKLLRVFFLYAGN